MNSTMKLAGKIQQLKAAALANALGDAQEIYVSGCSAEVPGLSELLSEAGITATITGITSPILNVGSYADQALRRRYRTFFLNAALRRDMAAGLVDFCPWTYGAISKWLSKPKRFDAAIVMVSPPDADGLCSFGTQSDFLPDFYQDMPRLIGVINPNMPRTLGVPGISLVQFSTLFELDVPVMSISGDDVPDDPLSETIARHVANLIPDGATIQMGIGKVPQALTQALVSHRHLRVHTGLVDSNIIALEASGALSSDHPIVTGVAMGSRELYDLVHENPRFRFAPASYTHAAEVLANTPKLIAMNGALQVDLFGQLNSEGGDGRILASPGGLPEFLRGAQRSEGGLVIVALKAQRGRKGEGGIVAQISEPRLVTGPRYDIDVVVTEHGAMDLRQLSLDQRAEALISLADPDMRATLTDRWAAVRKAGLG